MENHKVILLAGYARGGTNITWNILQSHPQICSPVHETGTLFKKSLKLRVFQYIGEMIDCSKLLDKEITRFKIKNLQHDDNKFKSEDLLYSEEEIKKCAVCLKSVNNQIYYTEKIAKTYPDLYFIGLTRNGYSLADGYIRRGMSAEKAGAVYYTISEEMKRLSENLRNFKLLKFEDVIRDPFKVAEELFAYTEMEPEYLEKLRFKTKKVINPDGNHKVRFGKEHRKYWVNRDNLDKIIDKNIDSRQKNRLSDEQIKEFNKQAAGALSYFNYKIL